MLTEKNVDQATVIKLNEGFSDDVENEESDLFMEYMLRIVTFFLIAAIIMFIKTCVIDIYLIPTSSMEPTIRSGEFIVGIKKWLYKDNINRGDIIVFLADEEGVKNKLVKRVIGLPGETVTIAEGMVFVDGEPLEEEYIKEPWEYWANPDDTGAGYQRTEVPEGKLFVMGDNRMSSKDSRYWGCIDISSVESKIINKGKINYDNVKTP